MFRFLKPLIAACTLAAGVAHAFPERPITIVVPYAPGGAADAVARVVATRLGAKLGGSVIVDNKAGASGTIGASFVAKAPADGYTMLYDATPHSINPHLFPKMPYAANALQPLSLVLLAPNVLIVKSDAPYKNVGELIAKAKAQPGKINFASGGSGTVQRLAAELFRQQLGLDMVHVPYKGGPEAITSVLRGETCCIMNQVQTVLAHYKSGKVRLLGITTAKPVDAVKEVPTIAASGLPGTKGFDSSIWFGIFAPKGTDPTVVNKLNTALRQVLELPEIRQRFESQGNTVRIETPEQFRQTVRKDRAKWAQVVKDAKISIN